MAFERANDAETSTSGSCSSGSRQLWVVGNRLAGRGRALRLGPGLERWFARRGQAVTFFWPGSREELRELARRAAAAGQKRLVVLGGDGTLFDVVNATNGLGMELGVVPAGDANDVARAIGVPRHPLSAAELLIEGRALPIDLVRARTGGGRDWVYVGVGGAGLDAEAARLASVRFRRLAGMWRYLAGALVALRGGVRFEARIDWDGQCWRGVASMIAVANAPAYGGGIRIAPGARMDDGLLDVVVVGPIEWRKAWRALPRLAWTGEIQGLQLCRFRARQARIEA